MFSYTIAVFGLKHSQTLSKLMTEIKRLKRQNVVVFEHGEEEEICGRPFQHYHGIFEHYDDLFSFENENAICAIKNLCCYFKSEDYCNAVDITEILNRFSMKYIISSICEPSNLFVNRIERPFKNTFTTYRNMIIRDEDIFRPNSLIYRSIQTGLNSAIVDLCTAFNSHDADIYLSPEASISYVVNWCVAQNITPESFVDDWIMCLDRKIKQRNVLYFQGPRDSSVMNIVDSIMDACGHFSYRKMQDTTGYAYFWNNCINKRLIALMDPHFDGNHCYDKLLEVFEGSGSHVKMNDGFYSFMEQTPVVVVAREHGWENNHQIETNVKDRMISYRVDLKSFHPPIKRLHPLWLTVLDARYRMFQESEDCLLISSAEE